MSTKSWSKLSSMLNEILVANLNSDKCETVMENWNSRKSDIMKVLNERVKKQKDPNAPKKWSTSYILFCNDHREKIKKSNPELKTTDITVKLGKMWKEISQKDRDKYETASQREKERYEKDVETYNENKSSEQDAEEVLNEKKTKKEKKPRVPSGYLMFCEDNRAKVRAKEPMISGTEITKRLAALWTNCSKEEKQVYENRRQMQLEKMGQTVVKKVPQKKKETKKENFKTPGFEYFFKDQSEELETENWEPNKIQKEVMKRWNQLSEEDRQDYEKEAKALAEEDCSELELEDE